MGIYRGADWCYTLSRPLLFATLIGYSTYTFKIIFLMWTFIYTTR